MPKFALEKTLRVHDVMTTGVFAMSTGMTVDEARECLHARHISGAPVVSSSGIPVGIVTRADLFDPRRHAPEATVDTVMTRVLYAVRPEDHVATAAQLMLDESIHRALVIDERGNIVGIVTPMDILRGVLRVDPAEARGPIEYVKISRG